MLTYQPTHLPTYLRTDISGYRVAFQFLDAIKNNAIGINCAFCGMWDGPVARWIKQRAIQGDPKKSYTNLISALIAILLGS